MSLAPFVANQTDQSPGSLSQDSTSPGEGSEGRHGSKTHLIEFMDEQDARQHSVSKGFRITYSGKATSNIDFLLRQREEDDTVHHFPSEDIIRQGWKFLTNRTPKEAFMLPNKSLADELVQAYFSIVNPGCPLVDEEVFMREYSGKNPDDPPSLLLLNAIMLVGAHVSRPRPERDTLKAAFFQRAKMLFDSRVERNRDINVQALILLTWHSEGTEDIVANTWYWIGVAARIAVSYVS